MSNIYLIAFWIDRPSTLFAVISYDMCTVCIIYLISYVFWFQNLHLQHIWKGKCYNKRTTAYFKKNAFPLMKPLHYFCLSNLLFWWNTIYRSVMQYLLLCLISKARKTSRNLEEIITSTNKICCTWDQYKSLQCSQCLQRFASAKYTCKSQKNYSGIPTFEGNLLFG